MRLRQGRAAAAAQANMHEATDGLNGPNSEGKAALAFPPMAIPRPARKALGQDALPEPTQLVTRMQGAWRFARQGQFEGPVRGVIAVRITEIKAPSNDTTHEWAKGPYQRLQ